MKKEVDKDEKSFQHKQARNNHSNEIKSTPKHTVRLKILVRLRNLVIFGDFRPKT